MASIYLWTKYIVSKATLCAFMFYKCSTHQSGQVDSENARELWPWCLYLVRISASFPAVPKMISLTLWQTLDSLTACLGDVGTSLTVRYLISEWMHSNKPSHCLQPFTLKNVNRLTCLLQRKIPNGLQVKLQDFTRTYIAWMPTLSTIRIESIVHAMEKLPPNSGFQD